MQCVSLEKISNFHGSGHASQYIEQKYIFMKFFIETAALMCTIAGPKLQGLPKPAQSLPVTVL